MEDSRLKLGCVVLAAGNASRFGSNKLFSDLEEKSLIRRTLDNIPADAFDAVTVVTQYPEIMRLAEEYHFSAVCNSRPDLGLSRSVALGLAQVESCDGAAFVVSDQPLMRRQSLESLVSFWRAAPQFIAALGHGGVRGNPCIFPARFYPELAALKGDVGGAAVIRAHEREGCLHLLEVAEEELADVDTPEALEQLKAGTLR